MKNRIDRRMAIPLEEIEANMVSNGTASSRYSRKDTFISELEAEARHVTGMLIMGVLALLAICLGLWACFFALGKAEAHQGHIYAKSEMTAAEIKQLNIMKPTTEKR